MSVSRVTVTSFIAHGGKAKEGFGFGVSEEGRKVFIPGSPRRYAVVRVVPRGKSGTPFPKVSLVPQDHEDAPGKMIRDPQEGDILIGYVSPKPKTKGQLPSLVEWTHLGLWESAHEKLLDLLEQTILTTGQGNKEAKNGFSRRDSQRQDLP